MSLLCRIGMHKWKGCKCDACARPATKTTTGARTATNAAIRTDTDEQPQVVWLQMLDLRQDRDESHTWSLQCSECGKGRDEEHDWSKD